MPQEVRRSGTQRGHNHCPMHVWGLRYGRAGTSVCWLVLEGIREVVRGSWERGRAPFHGGVTPAGRVGVSGCRGKQLPSAIGVFPGRLMRGEAEVMLMMPVSAGKT